MNSLRDYQKAVFSHDHVVSYDVVDAIRKLFDLEIMLNGFHKSIISLLGTLTHSLKNCVME